MFLFHRLDDLFQLFLVDSVWFCLFSQFFIFSKRLLATAIADEMSDNEADENSAAADEDGARRRPGRRLSIKDRISMLDKNSNEPVSRETNCSQ